MKFSRVNAIAIGVILLGAIASIPEPLPLKPKEPEPVAQLQLNSQEEANVRAFLDTIAKAEVGTVGKEGYRKLVFGGKFNSFRSHPFTRKCDYIGGRRICSDAAGRYQMMGFNWHPLRRRLRLKDFSPESQDKMAIALIKEKGALADVKAGRFEVAARKVGRVWASFPHNTYRQNPKSIAALKRIYLRQRARYRVAR